jgi:hypothetical protein
MLPPRLQLKQPTTLASKANQMRLLLRLQPTLLSPAPHMLLGETSLLAQVPELSDPWVLEIKVKSWL